MGGSTFGGGRVGARGWLGGSAQKGEEVPLVCQQHTAFCRDRERCVQNVLNSIYCVLITVNCVLSEWGRARVYKMGVRLLLRDMV